MSLVPRCAKQFQAKCNFSIDHILNVAGEKNKLKNVNDSDEEQKFDWLNCTRYKPPKLQRQRKRDGVQRRKLGRNPRIPFSSSQVALLEAKFITTPYLSSSDVTQLAANLQLSETRVKIWFQNRRARERRDRETKRKPLQATGDAPGQPPDCHRLGGICPGRGFLPPASADPDPRREQINFYNSLRGMRLVEENTFVQLFLPLDLSERQLMCK